MPLIFESFTKTKNPHCMRDTTYQVPGKPSQMSSAGFSFPENMTASDMPYSGMAGNLGIDGAEVTDIHCMNVVITAKTGKVRQFVG
jgi:hypothetical protein